ncbi:hypothetical protein Tco_1161485, partial [Tanacetum coccineum]
MLAILHSPNWWKGRGGNQGLKMDDMK